MIKFFLVLIISVLLILSCSSITNSLLDSFQTINNSLIESSKNLNRQIDSTYALIKFKKAYDFNFLKKADSIYLSNKSALVYIDALKSTLEKLDPSKSNLNTSTKMLVSTPIADTLAKKLILIYSLSSFINGKYHNPSLDSSLKVLNEVKSNKNWSEKYFKSIPSIAAITILTKFQVDCENVTIVSLDDLNIRK